MVLGVQWLETLGEIRWDFKQLRMEFTIDGKKHVLQGSSNKAELKTINSKGLEKLLSQPTECSMVHLCSLQIREDTGEGFHYSVNGINVVKEESMPEPVVAL